MTIVYHDVHNNIIKYYLICHFKHELGPRVVAAPRRHPEVHVAAQLIKYDVGQPKHSVGGVGNQCRVLQRPMINGGAFFRAAFNQTLCFYCRIE